MTGERGLPRRAPRKPRPRKLTGICRALLAAALACAAVAGPAHAGAADGRPDADAAAVFDALTKRFEPPALQTAQAEGDASSTLKIEPGDEGIRYDSKINMP